MIRIAAITAALALVPMAAQSQSISSTRLYKMCAMEDPECPLTFKTVSALAGAKLANTPGYNPQCLRVPEQELYFGYMKALQRDDGYLSRLSAIDAMYVLLYGCSFPPKQD